MPMKLFWFSRWNHASFGVVVVVVVVVMIEFTPAVPPLLPCEQDICIEICFFVLAIAISPTSAGSVAIAAVLLIQLCSPNKRSLRREWGSYLPCIELPLKSGISCRGPLA